jgi:hypothetical protein
MSVFSQRHNAYVVFDTWYERTAHKLSNVINLLDRNEELKCAELHFNS